MAGGAAVKYARRETECEVTLSPQSPAAATVIWLHGLGADGWDFVPVVSELGLPDDLPVRFIFPHAPVRPVTRCEPGTTSSRLRRRDALMKPGWPRRRSA